MSLFPTLAQRLALTAFVALLIVGCGSSRGADNDAEQSGMFRQPHPTFTPTAQVAGQLAAPAAPIAAAPNEQQSASTALDVASQDPPRAVVNAPLVNVRSAPNTDSDIVATVERGAEYEILGRSDDREWWRVCCQDELIVWIAGDYVDTDGAVDSVPVGESAAAIAEPASPAAVAPISAGLGGNADLANFQLIAKEQFPESNLVRVYLYVYDSSGALAGYTLRILKDGREIPVSAQSFGGQPAFTWPFQDARQRYQNLKIEFPNETPAGTWSLQLIDPQGRPAGPAAEFTLAGNDAQQELYVRYERGQ